MKQVKEELNKTITTIEGQATNFEIKSSVKAFQVLSEDLYSDKERAVVRELSTNALDAHKEANIDKPFDVHLPNEEEPTFFIRDYGNGLSEEDIYKYYTTYFSSTKEESNLVTGMLGLGSKSPFAYTDTFTVTSFQEGYCKIYIMSINEEGYPQIKKVYEDETDEPNGLKVELAVSKRDFYTFERTAKFVYRSYRQLPNINKEISHKFLLDDFRKTKNVLVDKDTYIVFKEDRYISKVITLIQGNVEYTIDVDIFLEKLTNIMKSDSPILSKIKLFFKDFTIIEEVGIGTFDVAPSREMISMNSASIKNIGKHIYSIITNLEKDILELSKKNVSLFDKVCFIGAYTNINLPVVKDVLRIYTDELKELYLVDKDNPIFKLYTISYFGLRVTKVISRVDFKRSYRSTGLAYISKFDYFDSNEIKKLQYTITNDNSLILIADSRCYTKTGNFKFKSHICWYKDTHNLQGKDIYIVNEQMYNELTSTGLDFLNNISAKPKNFYDFFLSDIKKGYLGRNGVKTYTQKRSIKKNYRIRTITPDGKFTSLDETYLYVGDLLKKDNIIFVDYTTLDKLRDFYEVYKNLDSNNPVEASFAVDLFTDKTYCYIMSMETNTKRSKKLMSQIKVSNIAIPDMQSLYNELTNKVIEKINILTFEEFSAFLLHNTLESSTDFLLEEYEFLIEELVQYKDFNIGDLKNSFIYSKVVKGFRYYFNNGFLGRSYKMRTKFHSIFPELNELFYYMFIYPIYDDKTKVIDNVEHYLDLYKSYYNTYVLKSYSSNCKEEE